MTNSPKISIIIPSFNQGRYIEETILSVINQSYNNFELIVIDGGSTDDTIEVIKKYQKHLTYWVSEKDSGQSEAINKGIKVASGEIITWLNSDDYFEPKAFETIITELQKHPEVSVIHGKAILFGKGMQNKIIGLEKNIPLHEYLAYMRFPQPSSFYRKKVFDRVGGVNNSLHYVMDFDLIVRTILEGFLVKRIEPVLSRYRLHEKSKSNHSLRFMEEWSRVEYAIFNSFTNGKEFAERMLDLGLVKKEINSKYESKINLATSQLESVFLLHLKLYYHTYYQELNWAACSKVSAFLKKNYPEFYSENKFKKYDFRLKFIPKFVIRFLRRKQITH